MEQYSRVSCLEHHNYPYEKDEDILSMGKSVSTALDYRIDESKLDCCHRLQKKNDGKPPSIIIKFWKRTDKEALLQKKRLKYDFSTCQLGLIPDVPLYVNESLYQERRKVLALTRNIKIS